MGLLWADGFDHYGSDETNLLDGLYATASNVTLTTDQAATGTHSIRIDSSGDASSSGGLRFVLPTAKDKVGAIARFYFPNFPTGNEECVIFDFLSSVITQSQVACLVDANGRISFYRGARTQPTDAGMGQETLIAQTDPILNTAAWNHVEVQIYIHDTLGWVRVAVNGVHRYEATGLDTKHDASNIVSIRTCRYEVGTQDGDFYMDDLQLYDFVGDSAVDTDWVPLTDGAGVATNYIGELQCMYLPPNGDTAETDWIRLSGANDYEMIDETDPNDADYVYSTAAGDLAEYELTDLPPDISYIRGLILLGRMSKSDAGIAMIKFGMKSDAATADSAEFPITVEPTYWYKFQNTDPDSTARWTRASLNAAWFRLTRSA